MFDFLVYHRSISRYERVDVNGTQFGVITNEILTFKVGGHFSKLINFKKTPYFWTKIWKATCVAQIKRKKWWVVEMNYKGGKRGAGCPRERREKRERPMGSRRNEGKGEKREAQNQPLTRVTRDPVVAGGFLWRNSSFFRRIEPNHHSQSSYLPFLYHFHIKIEDIGFKFGKKCTSGCVGFRMTIHQIQS